MDTLPKTMAFLPSTSTRAHFKAREVPFQEKKEFSGSDERRNKKGRVDQTLPEDQRK